MNSVAACLKVQIGNKPVQLKSVIENFYNFADIAPPEVMIEQVIALSFLGEYFSGFTNWFNMLPLVPMPMPEGDVEVIQVGFTVDENANSLDDVFNNNAEPASSNIASSITLSGYDDAGLKEGVKNLIGVGVPPNWTDLVDNTPASELQNLIDDVGSNESQFQIHYEPIELKIHRCTQDDISGLFQGDHPPHVDMFESVRFMLTGRLSELDDRGLSPAYYDSANDVIVLRSNYYTTRIENLMQDI